MRNPLFHTALLLVPFIWAACRGTDLPESRATTLRFRCDQEAMVWALGFSGKTSDGWGTNAAIDEGDEAVMAYRARGGCPAQ
jgi:hypothetical protein